MNVPEKLVFSSCNNYTSQFYLIAAGSYSRSIYYLALLNCNKWQLLSCNFNWNLPKLLDFYLWYHKVKIITKVYIRNYLCHGTIKQLQSIISQPQHFKHNQHFDYDSMMSKKDVKSCVQMLEELSESLEKRYDQKNHEEKLKKEISLVELNMFILFLTMFGILLRITSGWSLSALTYLVLSFFFL